ncbi:MAG TPA: CRISPR-associated endonuclease Cas2 [Candidatus Anammoximicrobium sp.]|nr:CRISPR-associated endonuclease Cas2 [Candidatus Anammoximicrobium sp.]
MIHYLIAYDIASPQRLRRVARYLEKHAIRCQKSVFVFDGPPERLCVIMEGIEPLINPKVDLVQAWKLAPRETPKGQRHGTPPTLYPDIAILDGKQRRFFSETDR